MQSGHGEQKRMSQCSAMNSRVKANVQIAWGNVVFCNEAATEVPPRPM